MDTGVFSSAGRQRTSGETKRKLEINAYKLIQEVVAASMAGCGDSPGSSRSDDVKGSSESVRQTARSPAAVAADALAAELGRAVADHRLPTAQFSSCSSRSGGPSPSEEGQAVGGPTGVEAAAERAGAGQTLQRQPLQQGEKQQPHQQQQGEQLRQRQQESQEQQRQHQQQQQHQQHLLYQQPQQHHQQQQQHQQHQQQQQHQQEQHQQPQHQQANRPREDGDRPGQRQSSPPSPPPKPPRALPAVESRSDPAETVSEATGPPSEVSPSVALPSLSRSAPPSEGRSAAAAAVDSDPDPDLEWLQRHAPVGGSGDHSAAETDDQVSDTALESDSAGLLPGGDSDSPAEGERHTESNGRQQATPGTAVYQRTVTEPPSAGGCLTTPPSAGGCLTALPAAGRTLGRPPQPPLSALTDTVSSTGCGSSSGSSAVTSPGGRGTPKGGRRTRPAAAAVALSPAPTGRAAPAPAVRAPAAAPRWADRAPAAGAAQVAVERTAPGRSETAIQTSQSLLPATVVSPQSEDGSSSALLQSGCCQTTPPAGLSAACQTQPDSPDRQQAGCQTETPGGAAGNLSLPPSPPGGATGHRPAQRTGGDGSLSRSDSSGHRSTASGEDLSEGEVLLPAWLRWVGAAGSATTVRSSAVTLAAASRHTIGSHLKEQEAAETTLSEGEVTGDMVPVGTFPSMSTLGPARSALGPGLSGTTLAPSGTTLGPGPSRTTLGPGPSRSTLGPSGSHLSAGQRRSSHLSTGGSHLAVSRGQLVAGRGSLPRPVPSVDSVPAARTASDSRLSAVRTGPGPQSAARSEVSGRPAARAASSPRLSTVGDRPSARRRRSWAAPAPAGADRPPEPGDLSDGEVSGSVRVRHVHIRPVRAGPTFELGEEGGPAPASEGLCSEGEAAEDGGLWTDQASLHQ
ncbi:AF4/FMR2 family member lilli-like [Amphibalanus amphitrite]|uniref:AF4/FMR2 family member lilli-like n=1 Tax=Amphibalanus amphitrite TaxID=1232801 RepID=UPI001C90F9E3|nr:AF4/FMR2 family member lilli-like [Amphibalanus amphitrite]